MEIWKNMKSQIEHKVYEIIQALFVGKIHTLEWHIMLNKHRKWSFLTKYVCLQAHQHCFFYLTQFL
jgi:hypothetical protein